MHIINFEPTIERQLDQIATRTGKEVDQLIEQVVLDFLKNRADTNDNDDFFAYAGLWHDRVIS